MKEISKTKKAQTNIIISMLKRWEIDLKMARLELEKYNIII